MATCERRELRFKPQLPTHLTTIEQFQALELADAWEEAKLWEPLAYVLKSKRLRWGCLWFQSIPILKIPRQDSRGMAASHGSFLERVPREGSEQFNTLYIDHMSAFAGVLPHGYLHGDQRLPERKPWEPWGFVEGPKTCQQSTNRGHVRKYEKHKTLRALSWFCPQLLEIYALQVQKSRRNFGRKKAQTGANKRKEAQTQKVLFLVCNHDDSASTFSNFDIAYGGDVANHCHYGQTRLLCIVFAVCSYTFATTGCVYSSFGFLVSCDQPYRTCYGFQAIL